MAPELLFDKRMAEDKRRRWFRRIRLVQYAKEVVRAVAERTTGSQSSVERLDSRAAGALGTTRGARRARNQCAVSCRHGPRSDSSRIFVVESLSPQLHKPSEPVQFGAEGRRAAPPGRPNSVVSNESTSPQNHRLRMPT